MDIEYKNIFQYDEFGKLDLNESFLYGREVYIKIEQCLYRKMIDRNAGGNEKNAIKIKDMTFHNFSAECKIKPVKAKVIVEED